jgi:hypothetical protein
MQSIQRFRMIVTSRIGNYVKKIVSVFLLLPFSAFTQNIGINLDGSAPETGVMLHVKGANLKATTAFQNIFQVSTSDATSSQLKMRLGLNTHTTAASRYSALELADLASPTVYRPLVLQPSGGQVGIGTNSVVPSAYLHINPTSTSTANTTNFESGIHHNINPALTMATWKGIHISAPGGTGTITNKFAFVTESGAGNVGIGTSTPGAQLEVNGQVKITGGSPAAGNVLMSDATGLASWSAYVSPDVWADAGTYIYPAGGASKNVSIGTTSAHTSKLYVYNNSSWPSSGTTTLFLNDNSVSTTAALILDLDFVSATSATSDDKFIRFMRNGNEVGSVNTQVVYSTFTGGHIGHSYVNGTDWEPGMIVCVSEDSLFPAAGKSAFYINVSAHAYDKSAIGVFTGIEKEHNRLGMDPAKCAYSYNALGDGLILVTDQGGDIRIGDYITTSDLPGYGMKQNDDLIHNYTVAKATDTVDWSKVPVDTRWGFKWKLVSCTYHGG